MIEYKENNIPESIDGIEVIQEEFMACECLSNGREVVRYEFGDSMFPILKSGQFCKLTPLKKGEEVNVGDCVFSLINGTPNTHMVWQKIKTYEGIWYCIATTQGSVMGWTQEILAKAKGIPHIVKQTTPYAIHSTSGFGEPLSISDRDRLRSVYASLGRYTRPQVTYADAATVADAANAIRDIECGGLETAASTED